jgi:hypothetical protein
MVLFMVVSFFYYLKFSNSQNSLRSSTSIINKEKKSKFSLMNKLIFLLKTIDLDIFLSGLAAGISLMFLQKAIFFIAICFGILCYEKFIAKRVKIINIIWWSFAMILPFGIYLVYLFSQDMVYEYWLTNWIFNLHFKDSFSILLYLGPSLKTDFFFWLFSILGIIAIIFKKKGSSELKKILVMALGLFGSILLTKVPYQQYFSPALVFLSILAAVGLKTGLGYLKKNSVFKLQAKSLKIVELLCFCLIFLWPLASLSQKTFQNINSGEMKYQLDRIQFVLDNTKQNDLVYDGDIQFNIYRKDVHYFWYSFASGFEAYNEITNGKYKDYNICQIIKEKKPVIISHEAVKDADCAVLKNYDQTTYAGVNKRIRN